MNIGISVKGELVLNHIGIELQGGINVFKPAYKVDWRINKGWGEVPKVIPESGGNFRLGDISMKITTKLNVQSQHGLG